MAIHFFQLILCTWPMNHVLSDIFSNVVISTFDVALCI